MKKSAPRSKKQPVDPVQAQRVDARRSQILDAATEVFADKGFHAATIRAIAQQAGLADGTIYLYFENKSDLLLGILNRLNESERRVDDLSRSLAPGIDIRGFFAAYVRHRLTVLDQNLRAFQAVLPDLLRSAELRERYRREVLAPSFKLAEPILEQWMAAGSVRRVNVKLALRAVPGLVLGMLVLRMLGDSAIERQWEELPEFITELLFDGLGKEKSI
jgi:TetR/AcrR family fatty acid metabolism transcriptional regulator